MSNSPDPQVALDELVNAICDELPESREAHFRLLQSIVRSAIADPGKGRWINADDVDRLVRDIDVSLNGEAGAAKQAKLCDIAGQLRAEAARRRGPVLVADPPPLPLVERYDAGLLSDHGGGNVEWWQHYIRAELDRAHDFYESQLTAPQADKARGEDHVSVLRHLRGDCGPNDWAAPALDAAIAALATPQPQGDASPEVGSYEALRQWAKTAPLSEHGAVAFAAMFATPQVSGGGERGRFEAWWRSTGTSFGTEHDPCSSGNYAASQTQCAWQAWQARAALSTPQARPDGGVKVPERCDHGRTMDEACDNYGCDREAHPAPAPDAARLVEALRQAARSLRAIWEQAGRTELMDDMQSVRGFANSRATVAEAALAPFTAAQQEGATNGQE